jgi:hypothetical protein
MKMGDSFDRVCQCRKQCRSPFKIVGLRQRPPEFPLDLEGRIVGGASKKPPMHLVGGDRITVTGEHVGVDAARNDLAVDQDPVAVEDDEIKIPVDFPRRFLHASGPTSLENAMA